MSTRTTILHVLGVAILTVFASSLANAQATRTWVSGVGDDVNPCSRTAPCKTFAGAISKTAVNGEIDCLDPGGFGTVTITKSITIDGGGTLGSILAAGTNGVNVNDSASGAPNTIKVRLRNLTINGAGTGINGINFTSGKQLFVENCVIAGFLNNATSRGIRVSLTAAAQLYVSDTNISNCSSGIEVTSSSGAVASSIDRVRLQGMTDGIILNTGSGSSIRDSFISGNSGVGVKTSGNAGTILERTMIDSNGTGLQPGGGTTTDISNVSIIGNTLGIATTGGSVFSHGNNQINLNTTPGATPTGIGQQ
jgi:hypothetical protein